jgi:uncharacterized protein (TIGR03437 family)
MRQRATNSSVWWLVFGVSLFVCLPALSQSGITVFGSSYSLPAPISAAPGQVLNPLVRGVAAQLSGPVTATSLPLPTSLAGISVTLRQLPPPQEVAVPILAVRPFSSCAKSLPPGIGPCGNYVVITIQMPFELGPTSNTNIYSAYLNVSENGIAGPEIEVNQMLDQVHVLYGCDVQLQPSCSGNSQVAHADGTLVTNLKPAKPGEELVLYAYGLGTTSPAAATGQAAPASAPRPIFETTINFDHRPNAPPSRPIWPPECKNSSTCPALEPVFSGLVPGYVGLYQVNFKVPLLTPGVPACGSNIAPGGYVGSTLVSNLTVSVVGVGSLDGAGICVDTSGGPTTSENTAARSTRALDLMQLPRKSPWR